MNSTNLIEDLRLLSSPNYEIWWLAVVGLVLLAAIYWLMRRPQTVPSSIVSRTPGTAFWDLALAELERLKNLLKAEHSREYAINSTGILRRYIEARYGFCAPKLATEEFLHFAAKSSTLPAAHGVGLRQFLENCDLLKFARYVATSGELENLHAAAVGFVILSRPNESRTQAEDRAL